jgi:hypothetical protein
MPTICQYYRRADPHDLLLFTCPDLWPLRPFLPVIRHPVDRSPEFGVLYDAVHVSGTYGLSATVFLANVFLLPRTEAEFLTLPRRVYDSPEELAADGWIVG